MCACLLGGSCRFPEADEELHRLLPYDSEMFFDVFSQHLLVRLLAGPAHGIPWIAARLKNSLVRLPRVLFELFVLFSRHIFIMVRFVRFHQGYRSHASHCRLGGGQAEHSAVARQPMLHPESWVFKQSAFHGGKIFNIGGPTTSVLQDQIFPHFSTTHVA